MTIYEHDFLPPKCAYNRRQMPGFKEMSCRELSKARGFGPPKLIVICPNPNPNPVSCEARAERLTRPLSFSRASPTWLTSVPSYLLHTPSVLAPPVFSSSVPAPPCPFKADTRSLPGLRATQPGGCPAEGPSAP